jgi:uncharacterized RDD family membrane protein YckC
MGYRSESSPIIGLSIPILAVPIVLLCAAIRCLALPPALFYPSGLRLRIALSFVVLVLRRGSSPALMNNAYLFLLGG